MPGKRFFLRDTVSIAKGLLGREIIVKNGKQPLSGIIVETEAYRGYDDPGSHAYTSRTKRNEIMFGPPGYVYVYFCYGNHFMLNFVTEKEGTAAAVLVRAFEPVRGIKKMMQNRRCTDVKSIGSGPGRLTQALGINREHNGTDLETGPIKVGRRLKSRFKTVSGPRIGIKQGLDKKWRFWIKDNVYVSDYRAPKAERQRPK